MHNACLVLDACAAHGQPYPLDAIHLPNLDESTLKRQTNEKSPCYTAAKKANCSDWSPSGKRTA